MQLYSVLDIADDDRSSSLTKEDMRSYRMSGRSTRSSDEAFVMRVERRGWHALGIFIWTTFRHSS